LIDGGRLVAAWLVRAAQLEFHRGRSCWSAGVWRNFYYTPARKWTGGVTG